MIHEPKLTEEQLKLLFRVCQEKRERLEKVKSSHEKGEINLDNRILSNLNRQLGKLTTCQIVLSDILTHKILEVMK